MADDILADLAASARPTGIPCARQRVERDRPDLLAEFDKAVASTHPAGDVAGWFSKHGVEMGGEAIRRHRVGGCVRCRRRTS